MDTRRELVRLSDFPKYSAQYIGNDFDITEIHVPEFTEIANKIIECVLEGVSLPDIFIVEKPDGMNVPLHPKAHSCLVTTILGIQQGWVTHPKYGPLEQWKPFEHRIFRMTDIRVISTPAGTEDPKHIELRKFIASFMYQG